MEIAEASDEEDEDEDKEPPSAAVAADFIAANRYQGSQAGCVFKLGGRGLGYYRDPKAEATQVRFKIKPAAALLTPARSPAGTTDFLPDVQVEATQRGIEQGKDQGNSLFAK